ncbi:MAG: Hsp70 family protein, partial [Verrucomicrobiota bacterium]
ADQTGPKHIQKELTRSKLETMTDHLFERTKTPVQACLKEAGLSSGEIDELVLVGGMTRMPKVLETARALAGKEPHKGVNPDEVVAIGAAIQGGVLQGDVKDVLLLDVTPLTLSIETMGGIATPMIERNTTIPAKKSSIFSTAADSQPSVDIVITQGERKMSRDNKLLGNFRLDGIEPAPRGVPQIEVTFDIDANGILHVSAQDKKTGKEQKISIEGSSGLSDDEIDRAKREAEEHADEDKQRKDAAEVRNTGETLVYQIEKQLAEMGDQVTEEQKKPLSDSVERLKKALETDDADQIKQATDELQKLFSEAMAAAQAAGFNPEDFAQAEGGAEAPPKEEPAEKGPKKAKGTVIDAEAEVVDD